MRNHHIYISLLVALLTAGCSQKHDVIPQECDITLSASVVDVQAATKVEGAYKGNVPSEDNPLAADLWFSLSPGNYSTSVPTDANTQLPCRADTRDEGFEGY